MITLPRRINLLMLTLLTVIIHGCGGGASSPGAVDTSSVQKGSVVQGPVVGATVFADNVAAGSRFVLDSGEIVAPPTGAAGNFFLPAFPSYDFVLVSSGGTDQITGLPALLLLAPAGSPNITPLTTLVALDTTKTVRAKLEALMGGTRFDTNVSTGSSPAVLLLIKSAETAVQLVSDAVKQAATAAGTTVSQAQLNHLQAQTWREIALAFAGTSEDLATPAGLDAALTLAVGNAIAAIRAEPANSNISSFASMSAAIIAHNGVNAALTALGAGVDQTSTTALSTLTVRDESSLSSSVFGVSLSSALAALKSLNSVTVIGVTPNPYSPQPIPVVTTTSAAIIRIITGASGGTGGTGVTF